MEDKELVEIAKKYRSFAYAPYSKFKVGAAVLTSDGEVYLGTNIENASFGLSMCAERNALFNAYCHGINQEDIEALAIVADTVLPVSPCGACRQVISELFPRDKPIYLANLNCDIKITNVDELLPYSFDSSDL